MAHPLQALRDVMAEYHIDAYLIPTADFHGSEYVGAHFACREYLSGFTGSAGTLLVFANWAGLWTDGRYFLQAAQQLEGSGIRLMKQGEPGVPTIEEFLRQSLQPEQTLGFDGRCVDARTGRRYHRLTRQLGAKLNHQLDLVDEIWPQRPPLSAQPVWELDEQYAGLSRRDKLAQLRRAVISEGADTFLLSTLEDIAWLLNLRGNDIPCDPVFLSYLILTKETCILFANPASFSPELLAELEVDGVSLRPYDNFYAYVNRFSPSQTVLLDTRRVNTTLLTSIPSHVSVLDRPNPTELRRADPLYLEPSFDPILATGAHSAIIHYSPTPESDAPIQPNTFLLADTGGHYYTGTTDCTRTYAMGTLTDWQKTCYTAVLRGNLHLAAAVFRSGCTGLNLDYLARQPLWDLGLDFNHGTGHGVGYLLSVHEGPQSIRWRSLGKEPALAPGMITSDEPGVYFDGDFGIRLENLVLCMEKSQTNFGTFLGFETLTLTPFDRDAMDSTQMTSQEKDLLNAYHARVHAAIAPHLPPEEAAWLAQATRPI